MPNDVPAALASALEAVAAVFGRPGSDERGRTSALLEAPAFAEAELEQLAAALRALAATDSADLDVEYVRLLLHGRPATAHPYESFYRTGLLMDPDCLAELGSLFASAGVGPEENSALPPDHLAVELEFLALLMRGLSGAVPNDAGAAALREIATKLLEEHLLPFSTAFCARLDALHPAPTFGAAAAALGLALGAVRDLLRTHPASSGRQRGGTDQKQG